MSRTAKIIVFLSIGLVIVILLVYPRLGFLKADAKKGGSQPSKGEAAGPRAGGGGPMTVDAVVLKAEPLNNKVLSTGTVMANEQVDIRSEISGKITGLYFKEGQAVKKGQLLIQVNQDELQAQRQKLEYSIKLNETQEFRQKKLLEKEAISQQEYDIVLTQLNSIRADLQQLKAQIAKYAIRAPFEGVIGLRQVSVGSYISPTTLVASMQDIDPVKIDFSISERYAALLKRGDKITFTINGETQGKQFEGEVYAIEPSIDLATRSVKVRALSPNKEGKLIPGAFARVELTVGTIENALLIPTEALVPTVKGQTVYLYKNGLARELPVKTGIRTERQIQIIEGVQVNDSLIVTGLLQLKDSTQVSVKIRQQEESENKNLTKR
jgi:membrane fusion protein (multidrug efflux system)